MGVCNLWNMLEPYKVVCSISDLSGQTVAVDLAGWIVQSYKASQHQSVTGNYMMMRVLLYRIVNLLKLGIKPVFVFDGTAPDIKTQTLDKRKKQQGYSGSTSTERRKFKSCSNECIDLLESLGLPYILYTGEAEKMCAILNNLDKVTACMTEDSDCFLYGAKLIYRNYDHNKKDTTIEKYDCDDIQSKLKLTRRDLVAYALLAGCDYNETGVQGMGEKKTYSLIQELKETYSDVLDRILCWRGDEKIQSIKEIKETMSKTVKGRHCKSCSHPGSVDVHVNKGCDVCLTDKDCIVSNSIPCSCSWHLLQTQVSPYSKELEISDKALKNSSFPDLRIVSEFLTENDADVKFSEILKWQIPDLKKLRNVVKRQFEWSEAKMIKIVLPALVHMTLSEMLPLATVEPVRILSSCQDNFKACYEVEWKLMDVLNISDLCCGTTGNNLVKIQQSLFQSKYPQLVQEFEAQKELKKSSSKKGKRKTMHEDTDKNQTTINQFFNSRKHLRFDRASKTKNSKVCVSRSTDDDESLVID